MKCPLLVSVIVVTYNQQDSIGRTLESILAQQCDFDYEIIIGDDASTDDTRSVCADYMRRFLDKIHIMPVSERKGLVRNYFDCLAACRGRYVADCAGDDYWADADRLRRQVETLESDAGTVAVYSDWEEHDEVVGSVVFSADFSECKAWRAVLHDNKSLMRLILCRTGVLPVQLSAMLYRADVVRDAVNRIPHLVCNDKFGCEDVPIIATLIAAGKIKYVPLTALVYNVTADSVSRSADMFREFYFARNTLYMTVTLGKYYGLSLADVRTVCHRRLSYLAHIAYKSRSSAMCAEISSLAESLGLKIPMKARIKMVITVIVGRCRRK